jgi:hypothetical protein
MFPSVSWAETMNFWPASLRLARRYPVTQQLPRAEEFVLALAKRLRSLEIVSTPGPAFSVDLLAEAAWTSKWFPALERLDVPPNAACDFLSAELPMLTDLSLDIGSDTFAWPQKRLPRLQRVTLRGLRADQGGSAGAGSAAAAVECVAIADSALEVVHAVEVRLSGELDRATTLLLCQLARCRNLHSLSVRLVASPGAQEVAQFVAERKLPLRRVQLDFVRALPTQATQALCKQLSGVPSLTELALTEVVAGSARPELGVFASLAPQLRSLSLSNFVLRPADCRAALQMAAAGVAVRPDLSCRLELLFTPHKGHGQYGPPRRPYGLDEWSEARAEFAQQVSQLPPASSCSLVPSFPIPAGATPCVLMLNVYAFPACALFAGGGRRVERVPQGICRDCRVVIVSTTLSEHKTSIELFYVIDPHR